jgi:hypothetical protein
VSYNEPMIDMNVFQLVEGADDAAFLAADSTLQMEVAYQQPGLVRRTTARRGGTWLVLTLWASEAQCDAGTAVLTSPADPKVAAWSVFVDERTVRTARFEEVG